MASKATEVDNNLLKDKGFLVWRKGIMHIHKKSPLSEEDFFLSAR